MNRYFSNGFFIPWIFITWCMCKEPNYNCWYGYWLLSFLYYLQLLSAKLCQVNSNMPSSPDSSSDSSTSSPQHPYDGPNLEAENSLPGVVSRPLSCKSNWFYEPCWYGFSYILALISANVTTATLCSVLLPTGWLGLQATVPTFAGWGPHAAQVNPTRHLHCGMPSKPLS